MDFLLKFHGGLRWLVLLVGAVTVIRGLVGWLRRAEFQKLDRILIASFSGLLDLNVLLGLILLFGLGGGLSAMRIEHATAMLLATATAHLSAIWRRSDDDARKFRNNAAVVALALVLVLVGVIRLRGGWIF